MYLCVPKFHAEKFLYKKMKEKSMPGGFENIYEENKILI